MGLINQLRAGANGSDIEAKKRALLAEEAAAKNVMLTGAAAQEYAERTDAGPILPGTGVITSVSAAQAVGVLPPDAPASGVGGQAAKPIPPEELATMSPAIQDAAKALEAAAPVPTIAEPSKRKPGRPKKTVGTASVTVATPTPKTVDATVEVMVDSGLKLYVNCEVDGVDIWSLDDYVLDIVRKIEEDAKVTDIRTATGDSPLAFGKWKGALAYVLRTHPPVGSFYLNDVAESEIRQVALEALWPLAVVRVRGRR